MAVVLTCNLSSGEAQTDQILWLTGQSASSNSWAPGPWMTLSPKTMVGGSSWSKWWRIEFVCLPLGRSIFGPYEYLTTQRNPVSKQSKPLLAFNLTAFNLAAVICYSNMLRSILYVHAPLWPITLFDRKTLIQFFQGDISIGHFDDFKL